jgi:hypothetical protein
MLHTSCIARGLASKPSSTHVSLCEADVIPSGTSFKGLSHGGSRFTQPLDHEDNGSQPAFSIRKSHNPFQITVRFHSKALVLFLKPLLAHNRFDVPRIMYECDITQILEHFPAIQTSFKAAKIFTALRLDVNGHRSCAKLSSLLLMSSWTQRSSLVSTKLAPTHCLEE